MKKIFGIVVPLIIFVAILGLLLFSYSAGRKGLGCNLDNEQGAQAGMKHFQPLINAVEQYKTEHGRYPENIELVNQNVLGNGQGFPNEKITGANVNLKADQHYFTITFFFDNDYVCLLGQARKCTYASSVYWGGKENESGKWRCE